MEWRGRSHASEQRADHGLPESDYRRWMAAAFELCGSECAYKLYAASAAGAVIEEEFSPTETAVLSSHEPTAAEEQTWTQ